MAINGIPVIDERIQFKGTTHLRAMTADGLRALKNLIVIQDGDQRLAVLIPYARFLEMQDKALEEK